MGLKLHLILSSIHTKGIYHYFNKGKDTESLLKVTAKSGHARWSWCLMAAYQQYEKEHCVNLSHHNYNPSN